MSIRNVLAATICTLQLGGCRRLGPYSMKIVGSMEAAGSYAHKKCRGCRLLAPYGVKDAGSYVQVKCKKLPALSSLRRGGCRILGVIECMLL